MPFWSDWLRSVARHENDERSPPAVGEGPRTARDDAPSLVPGIPDERAPGRRVAVERRVAPLADHAPGLSAAPGPSMLADRAVAHGPVAHGAVANGVLANGALANGALADRAVANGAAAALLVASEGSPVDEIGRWHVRVFDLLSDGVLLFGADGELAYRSAAGLAMTDDEGLLLLREARTLALAVLARGVGRRALGLDAARELTVGAVHFRLAAVPVPASLPRASLAPAACEPAVLVVVTRTSPPLPSVAVLRQRFQLTAREASVALLLAEGRSNAGVALRLGISANTVRHYIETVLLKLDVPSRAAVAAALLGVYEHTDEHQLPRIARSRRTPDAE